MRGLVRWPLAVIGLACLALSIWGIRAASAGLESTHFRTAGGIPVTVTFPEGSNLAARPLVLVGHGFAGSRSVMSGFALTLAHAGYVSASWDFDGHGANDRSWERGNLVSNPEEVLGELETRQLGDTERAAILGHSMGSGVALEFGLENPQTWATIAISPVVRPVTPQLPRNLLLMAGSAETSFVRNAQSLLDSAGGEGGDPAMGNGRKLAIIPGVEHVSILFSTRAHLESRQWLDEVFGLQPEGKTFSDRRMAWYALGVLGTFLLAAALAPLVTAPVRDSDGGQKDNPPAWRILIALFVGSLGASILLWLASLLGLELSSLLGMLVGGYLLIWFGLAGLIAALISGIRIKRPDWSGLLGGGLVFAGLWLGVGFLGQFVWLQWLLNFPRLILWPLGILAFLPWLLVVGEGVRRAHIGGKVGWWLANSVAQVGGLVLAIFLNPELGFITIILPLFPIVLGLHALAFGAYRGRWAFALSGAGFVSWMVLSVFPLY